MDEPAAWRLVCRLARVAGIDGSKLNPHSFRHGFVTAALDAGVPLRDVPDAAGHADPRTTRRYDRSRHNLDRAATYAVTAFLAGDDQRSGSDEL
jgi:integrase